MGTEIVHGKTSSVVHPSTPLDVNQEGQTNALITKGIGDVGSPVRIYIPNRHHLPGIRHGITIPVSIRRIVIDQNLS